MTRTQALEAVVQQMRTIVAAREAEEGEGPITRLALDDAEQALDTLDAISADLAADGYAVEQDWQPIATAPKDGTRFIAWWQPCQPFPAGGWGECQWWNGAWHHPIFTEPTHWKPPPVDGPHLAAAGETQA